MYKKQEAKKKKDTIKHLTKYTQVLYIHTRTDIYIYIKLYRCLHAWYTKNTQKHPKYVKKKRIEHGENEKKKKKKKKSARVRVTLREANAGDGSKRQGAVAEGETPWWGCFFVYFFFDFFFSEKAVGLPDYSS